jgi:hypothetical protein
MWRLTKSEGAVNAMPKKKTPVRNPWTKEDLRQLKSPFENKDTCCGGREGIETNRGGGPAKGEDNRPRSRSSSLKRLVLIDSSDGNRV